MRKALLKCPVCHKPLTQDEYDKALGLWKTKEEHIHRLKIERRQIEEERKRQVAQAKRLQKEYQQRLAVERSKSRQAILERERQFKEWLKQSRAQWERATEKVIAARVNQGVLAGVAREKKALKRKEDALRKEQSKREQMERLLDAAIRKSEQDKREIKQLREQRVVSAKRREKEKMWPGLGDRS